jgi:hypothetical protein
MQVYPIPEGLAPQYQGAGYALAAHQGDVVLRIVYLRDALPDFDDQGGKIAVRLAIKHPAVARIVRELQALGEVSVGMCSCWEFVVL